MTTFPHAYLSKVVDVDTVAAKRARGICVKHRCRRKAQSKKGGVCNTCSCRMRRLADEVHYAWENLKRSASKRSIEFHITIEEWRSWCMTNDYIACRGRATDAASVNRRKPWLGYSISNIEVQAYGLNSGRAADPKPDDKFKEGEQPW